MLQWPRGDVGGHDDLSSDRLTSMLLHSRKIIEKKTLPKFFKVPSLKLTYPLKMDGWNTRFLLKWPSFRGYVSFREGKVFEQTSLNSCWETLFVVRFGAAQDDVVDINTEPMAGLRASLRGLILPRVKQQTWETTTHPLKLNLKPIEQKIWSFPQKKKLHLLF